MENNNKALQESLWYVDNYVLLKDYYDRTISRIAARCIRQGNIAIEEYPFYAYILDILEEITETGNYIMEHKELYPYVEKKIAGGMAALKKSLNEYSIELRNNASPDMIKQDPDELKKMKEALGQVDTKAEDPTKGAGMNMDEVVEKLMNQQNIQSDPDRYSDDGKRPELSGNRPRPAGNPGQMRKIVKIKKPTTPENRQVPPAKQEN